jgi:hypothetical protein
MKKFDISPKDFRKFPLDKEEHVELAADLRAAQKILEPWVQRFYHAYPVNGKEVKELIKTLNLLSSKICSTQDSHWYSLKETEVDGHNCPYYGKGKSAWI